MQNTLLVYYSYSGTTRKIAREISKMGNYDLEEIHETTPRALGIRGFVQASYESLTKQHSQVENLYHNLKDYDHVIIGTPVWAGHMASAIRGFIENNRHRFKSVSLFCTYGGSGGISVLNEMAQLIGLPIKTSFAFSSEIIEDRSYLDKRIQDFLSAWPTKFAHKKAVDHPQPERIQRANAH